MTKLFKITLVTIILCFTTTFITHANDNLTPKYLSIVIDDFGNNMIGTNEMLELDLPITVAVMPFLPSSKQDAITAHKKGYEILLHLPMEPNKGKASWLGPNPIQTSLSTKEIRSRVLKALDEVPYAIGINNHMGSKATADKRVMEIIMRICKERGLVFLNSRTNSSNVSEILAKKYNVPYLENDYFFDDVYEATHINHQASKLISLFDKKNNVVAIGHVGIPGKMTSNALRTYSPVWRKKVLIVPISKQFYIKSNKYKGILPFTALNDKH
ncbi:MAG: divergent polysaccharide deacetylase family protein [Bacillales bacterium]|nr:divergent polysaccharide deacetylase family protein [Bacillales bacterium]